MSKKDKSQVRENVSEEVIEDPMAEATSDTVATEATSEAEKLERFKAMKREAAQRFKEKRAKEKEERVEKAGKLISSLKERGLYDQLDPEQKAFLDELANPSANVGASNQSLFKLLFGDSPKVGDSITLNEAFQRTLKGKSNIDHYVNKWKEKGIIVTFKKADDNILNSTYVLESIGSSTQAAE